MVQWLDHCLKNFGVKWPTVRGSWRLHVHKLVLYQESCLGWPSVGYLLHYEWLLQPLVAFARKSAPWMMAGNDMCWVDHYWCKVCCWKLEWRRYRRYVLAFIFFRVYTWKWCLINILIVGLWIPLREAWEILVNICELFLHCGNDSYIYIYINIFCTYIYFSTRKRSSILFEFLHCSHHLIYMNSY